MILVTTLDGTQLYVDADVIETVESTPESVLTTVDGSAYLIHEPPAEIIRRVRRYRSARRGQPGGAIPAH